MGSFSDNFQKATELSTNPNLMKLAETYQTHYDFGQAFENASKGILIMGQSEVCVCVGGGQGVLSLGLLNCHYLYKCIF